MKTRTRRIRAVTLEDKLAYSISRSINVLFQSGSGVSVAAEVSSAFHKSGLSWRALLARCRTDWTLVGSSEEARFIDGLDSVATRFLRALPTMFAAGVILAEVGVSEGDFDQEKADPS